MGRRLDNAKALYLEAIRDGNPTEAIERYSGDRYTQHSTPVRDGKEGFKAFFADFLQRNPIRDIQIVRGFEDGRYVFLHVLQNLNDGEFRYVTADIFDTDDDGKLIEHWDMIEEVVDDTASGHSQLDGPRSPTDLDRTERNKTLVREYLTVVLQNGHHHRLADYLSPAGFVQHSPRIGDGIEGMQHFLESLASGGEAFVYEEIHNVIGCGDFVAALCKVKHGDTEIAVIDLFRVTDDRIVEHWDVQEQITPRESWVNSGKF